MNNKWWYKVGFYLLSMFFFLFIVIILGTKIPVYFGPDSEFIGWSVFLQKGVIIPLVCMALMAMSGFFCIWLKHWNKGSRMGPVTNLTVKNVSGDVMSFVAAYFFPLVSFNLNSTWQHAVVLALLFILIGAIYVKANLYYCNPTLMLLGFKVYSVKGTYAAGDDFEMIVISRDKLSNGDSIKYITIDDNTCFAYKNEK